jgi:predicted metal-dependent hydrolase
VSDLARLVVAAERGKGPGDVSVDVAERVRADLFQRHLPKLIATGVVSYNSLVGTVELASDDPRLLGEDGDGTDDRVDDPPTPE